MKPILRILGTTIELLSGYDPGSRQELETTVHEAERLVKALQQERNAILSDPYTQNEMVAKFGIDKLHEKVEERLRILYAKEQKFAVEGSLPSGKVMTGKLEEGPVKQEAAPNGHEEGIIAWFDGQETTVKVALIGAIVSTIGSLVGVVLAVIMRRD